MRNGCDGSSHRSSVALHSSEGIQARQNVPQGVGEPTTFGLKKGRQRMIFCRFGWIISVFLDAFLDLPKTSLPCANSVHVAAALWRSRRLTSEGKVGQGRGAGRDGVQGGRSDFCWLASSRTRMLYEAEGYPNSLLLALRRESEGKEVPLPARAFEASNPSGTV